MNSNPRAVRTTSETTAAAAIRILEVQRPGNGSLCLGKNYVAQVENESSAGYGTHEEKKRPEVGHISYSPDWDTGEQWLLHVADGFTTRNDAKQQAKSANVKSWACVNFSCISGEGSLRFLRSLDRACVNSGMDFSLEPTMLVHMSDPCINDIVQSLWSVHKFFDHHELEKDETKFLLEILPDARCSDERVEEICKKIGAVYHCCLPLYDRMAKKKYLKNAANEIKAKIIEWNTLSDSREDMSRDGIAEYYSYNYEEMGKDDGYNYEEMEEYDGYNYEEMGGDDGYDYEEMVSAQLCSSYYESGEYTSEEKKSEAGHISGSPDWEASEQQLLPSGGFTTITDAIPQAKIANVKIWACMNFSRISGKESLRFLSKLGNMCMSIGMDLSPEPTMLIHMNSSRETYINTSLWTVFEFFNHLKIGKGSLVLVILLEARYSHVDVKYVCESLGLAHQFCLPWHAIRASEKYLKNAANKIKTKVLQCSTLSDYGKDMSEDSDPKEFNGSDEETGEVGFQQFEDSDVEMGVQLYSSHNESGEQNMSEKLARFDKETAGDDSHNKESNHINIP